MDNITKESWSPSKLTWILILVLPILAVIYIQKRSVEGIEYIVTTGGQIAHETLPLGRYVSAVRWCTGDVTNSQLKHVVLANPRECVDLSGNQRIDDEGLVEYLILLNAEIELLDLRDTNVSSSGAARFVDSHNRCTVLLGETTP
jgi:uncharacterized membrane protein